MKLMTKEIERKMPALRSQKDKDPSEVKIVCKFFIPWSNWTWFVTEGEKQEDGDWMFFGLVQGMENELGYFMLSDLQQIKGPFGLKIERDRHLSANLTLDQVYESLRRQP